MAKKKHTPNAKSPHSNFKLLPQRTRVFQLLEEKIRNNFQTFFSQA